MRAGGEGLWGMEQALCPRGYLRDMGASPVCVSVRGLWGSQIVVCAPRDEPSPRCGDPSRRTVRVFSLGAASVAPGRFSNLILGLGRMQATKPTGERNPIPKDLTGSYVLLLELNRTRLLHGNRQGEWERLSPGWYLYAGSTFRTGGTIPRTKEQIQRLGESTKLTRRTDNLFKTVQPHEVWWNASLDVAVEHELAEAIVALSGFSAAAKRFGATDSAEQSEWHLFRFNRRPYTAELRRALNERMLGVQLFTKFVGDYRCEPSVSLTAEYELGRQLMERKHLAAELDVKIGSNWKTFAKGRPLRCLAETTSNRIGIEFKKLRSAYEFTSAVDTILKNCGAKTLPLLLDEQRPQSRSAIMQLSRTSDVRQRYRVGLVLAGLARSVGPDSGDTVYDTLSFGEVLSRLGRARGSVRQAADFLVQSCPDPTVVLECKRLSAILQGFTLQLLCFLRDASAPEANIVPRAEKQSLLKSIRCVNVRGKQVGRLRQAIRFVSKCV